MLLVIGCRSEGAGPPKADPQRASAQSSAASAQSSAASAQSSAVSAQSSAAFVQSSAAFAQSSAALELDRMDARAPVPLLPMMAKHQKENMRDHLLAVQEIVAAAGAGDFSAIESSARRMGYSQQMERMCNHMGAAAAGFSERALAFHHRADEIAEAARKRDLAAVLRSLGQTLGACTSCHAAFKQQVVTELPGARAP
jgi:multidrug efflux pump subunit AcrA (membrane-fusion protein)